MDNQARTEVADGASWTADGLTRARSVLERRPTVEALQVLDQTRRRSLTVLAVLVGFALVVVPVTILLVPPAELPISTVRQTAGHVVDAIAAVLIALGIVWVVRADTHGPRSSSPAGALSRPESRQLDAAIGGRVALPAAWRGVAVDVARRRAADLGSALFLPAGVATLMLGRILSAAGPFYQVAGGVLCVAALAVLAVRGWRLTRARRFLRMSTGPR